MSSSYPQRTYSINKAMKTSLSKKYITFNLQKQDLVSYRKWWFRAMVSGRRLLFVSAVAGMGHSSPRSTQWMERLHFHNSEWESYHHCQTFHLFTCQVVSSLLKAHTPSSFFKFITHFLHYWVWLDSDQRPTCKRLKTEGGSVLLEIHLVIRWKT